MDEPSDEELMARVAEGDEAAFRRLSRRHLPRALGLARRVTGNAADAEDVAQDALLRVWTTAPRWRPAASFRTWLYRVVVNLCLDRKRRPAFATLDDAGDPVDPAPDAAATLGRDETRRAVAQALASLPERQRVALALTYYEGLGNAETAAVLETSVSAVESLLIRAKRALREQLSSLRED